MTNPLDAIADLGLPVGWDVVRPAGLALARRAGS